MIHIDASALIDMQAAQSRLSEALALAIEENSMLKSRILKERKNADDILDEVIIAKEFLRSYLIADVVNEAFRKINWRIRAYEVQG